MGRTVPSYRIASDREVSRWKPFRQALNKIDRKKFDEKFSYSRMYNSAGSNACRIWAKANKTKYIISVGKLK